MNFIPSYPNNMQVLWQPVAVQSNQNQTLQALRAENQTLKQQLQAALKGKVYHTRQPFAPVANRTSFGSPPRCYIPFKQTPLCYSSKPALHHQRIYSNYSPRHQFPVNSSSGNCSPCCYNQSVIMEQPNFERIAVQKSAEGRSFQNNNQQSQSTWKTQPTKHTQQSQFLKPPGQESTLRNMSFKSPMKCSYLPYLEQTMCSSKKPSTGRFKSPTFLKNRKSCTSSKKVALIEEKRSQEVKRNQLSCRPTTPIDSTSTGSQGEQKISEKQEVTVDRKTAKLPTMDLSMECDSSLSIEKALHKLLNDKKTQKKGDERKGDAFLIEMEQRLQVLYGSRQ